MRISKIVCDGCGKEISGNPIKVFAERVERESGDFTEGGPIYAPEMDFCDECLGRIKNFVETMGEIPFFPLIQVPVTKEPASEEKDEQGKDEKTEPIKEEVPEEKPKKQKPKAQLSEKPELPKAPSTPSIKELVLQGRSKEEVCRMTGCTPLTYSQTKYQLRKKGLLPPAGETVKCSEVHDSCAYAETNEAHGMCAYIGMTGKMRGCPAEECDKYMKVGK